MLFVQRIELFFLLREVTIGEKPTNLRRALGALLGQAEEPVVGGDSGVAFGAESLRRAPPRLFARFHKLNNLFVLFLCALKTMRKKNVRGKGRGRRS